MTLSDLELLRDYVRRQSQEAFATLVRRHVNLVHSAALRQVRSTQLAEEIAQSVFTDLARDAAKLSEAGFQPAGSLSPWLYAVTRRTAIDVIRKESRRQLREQIATEMNAMNATTADWTQIEPLLDDAMSALDETDRAAVLLRYFENKSLREVGETLGTSDDAAQKRVSRAVERLREFFAKRRVTVGVSGLVVVISTNAVQAAPVGLAITISTAAALTGTTIAATATVAATKAIAMTTLQKTLVTAAIVATSAAIPLVIQHQTKVNLRNENQSLRQGLDQLAELQGENERLSNLSAQANAQSRPDNELLRLRGEVRLLRQQTNELGKLQEENQRLRSIQGQRLVIDSATTAAKDDFPRENWTFAGYADPESAVVSLAWAGAGADLETFLNSLTPRQRSEELENWERSERSDKEAAARERIAKEFGRTKRFRVLDKEALSGNEVVLTLLVEQEDGRNETPKLKVERIGNEWKVAGRYNE